MYKYAGAENQKTRHNKLPIELFTTAELVEELKRRINRYGVDIVGKLPGWLAFRVVAETYEEMAAHREDFED